MVIKLICLEISYTLVFNTNEYLFHIWNKTMMQPFYVFPPRLRQKEKSIHPIFIPFAGCATRCIFCAQEVQSGQKSQNIKDIYASIEKQLLLNLPDKNPEHNSEIAFFGGTFTCLPKFWQEKWLKLISVYTQQEIFSGIRCSTRPDAVGYDHLVWLKQQGMQTIELGVQSFDNAALALANRGYTGEIAEQACKLVVKAGLNLVIQLMPGLPGCTPEVFAQDIARTIALRPSAVRIYPCLVLKGTQLANMWQQGLFKPWALQETETHLGSALYKLWQENIPVIRVGLAPEPGLEENILAGPWHPALGCAVQGQALYLWVREKLSKLPGNVSALNIPKSSQGAFWGIKGALKPAYEALGIKKNNVTFWDWPIWRFDMNLEQQSNYNE